MGSTTILGIKKFLFILKKVLTFLLLCVIIYTVKGRGKPKLQQGSERNLKKIFQKLLKNPLTNHLKSGIIYMSRGSRERNRGNGSTRQKLARRHCMVWRLERKADSNPLKRKPRYRERLQTQPKNSCKYFSKTS